MLKAPMMLLEETAQSADIHGGKAPSDVIDGFARIKTYVKPDDWTKLFSGNMRSCMPFDQPFQIGSDRTGLDWNVTNRVFLGQLAKCNLNCPYCYVDREGFIEEGRTPPIVEVSSQGYVDTYLGHVYSEMDRRGVVPSGILRYSGGEPFLFQDWLAESVDYATDQYVEGYIDHDEIGFPVYVWVDTNLTVQPSEYLLSSLVHCNVGVCGCFKPGKCDLDEQLHVVHTLVREGVDLFMYYPSHGGGDVDMSVVLEGLAEICPNLPLRLWVIGIRWGYSAMKERRGTVSDDQAAADLSRKRKMLDDFVLDRCDRELLHLPSHQVPIG